MDHLLSLKSFIACLIASIARAWVQRKTLDYYLIYIHAEAHELFVPVHKDEMSIPDNQQ